MILTPTSERNLKNLNVALNTSGAVLVQGEVGCGKSFLVNAAAQFRGVDESMIHVSVDDSFDSRDLLGKYSATDSPGVFEWVPGPLTSAVQNGFWILMEDIDLASFDVFSVLLSLLEESTLFLPDKNKRINAHPNFKIIATQQLRPIGDALTTRKGNAVPFAELWGTVLMENLPPEEVCTIATSLYSVPRNIVYCLSMLPAPHCSSSLLVSLRTLLKWCKRVCKRVPIAGSLDGFISSTIRELMFREAYDCFLAGCPLDPKLEATVATLAKCMEIQEHVARSLVAECKPSMDLARNYFSIGRVTIPLLENVACDEGRNTIFAPTKHALALLERVAAAVEVGENVLLVGETGVGKTFIVQYLADRIRQKLIVHNLDQQADTSDLIGSWKPLDVSVAVRDAYQKFVTLFSQSFNSSRNVQFLSAMQGAVRKCNWTLVVKQILKGCSSFKLKNDQRPFSKELEKQWSALEAASQEILTTLDKTKDTFAFRFEEGSLTKAWREGSWILLDELNLASTEVLERVSSVLGDVTSLYLTEKADCEPIKRHKNFHVFANMNPPTDVGKKDIPPSLRSKFTEIYVEEPFSKNDIIIAIEEYVGHLAADCKAEGIAIFFLEYIGNAKSTLCSLDGEAKLPSVSLRTLTRALSYVRRATPQYGFSLALFDGLMLGFASSLQRQFHSVVAQMIAKYVFSDKKPPNPTLPRRPSEGEFVAYEHIWLHVGSEVPRNNESFILTPSVKGHLLNVARAVFADRPVLLEGPTSSGKSSMVKYLAELTGNKFVRINNHESTEIQEYIGHYVSDEHGKLRFVDGILVNAVRNGYWVVLDELNLAPTDVLEALNRLLDDNRELFVPDTQETIKPHPMLRIFATQNPAGLYGGRKLLSRAFLNRFLEITVDDIPATELKTILCQRYLIGSSFAEKMVDIMVSLQLRRQASQVFAGRNGFVTPRDLFRWAERRPETYQEMAEHGFLLLAERCRKIDERQIVKDVIESVTKTELDENAIYSPQHWPYIADYYTLVEEGIVDEFGIVWTESMHRLFTVVGICLHYKEPVLLVGETGSSKTTVCQLWAAILKRRLTIVNCHQHTEAADFLGSLRPVQPGQRSKSTADVICAHQQFRILATMNPGGDFGKRELSPALRNRFTEIYVRPTTNQIEVSLILTKRLVPHLSYWAERMSSLLCSTIKSDSYTGAIQHISIRDVISWATFMNAAYGHCDEQVAFMHGLDAVVLDGIGVGAGRSYCETFQLRRLCLEKAKELSGIDTTCLDVPFWFLFDTMEEPKLPPKMEKKFFFGAPSTHRNLSKLIRASVMPKAILLEGSPGVGKTSIVEALGCAMGKHIARINLSEQTDIMDLFGTFLPRPGPDDTGPQFSWSDGVLLQALRNGWWVILDELNLASQAVLEGLNALLDHRSAVFIPELGKEFQAAEGFRLFACQNPLAEGGGRKGLPRSFLNRFTKVRIEPFEVEDLLCITHAMFPDIDTAILHKMVNFVDELHQNVIVQRKFGIRGSPWEFNLRDVLRWAKLMQTYKSVDKPCEFVNMLFTQRMRTDADRKMTTELIRKHFGACIDQELASEGQSFLIVNGVIYAGTSFLAQRASGTPLVSDVNSKPLLLLPCHRDVVRSILICAEQNQFCLLTGSSGAGKTSCIRAAAALVGTPLVTFSMNASCDTVDLLGGFDQVEGKQGQFRWNDSLILEAMQLGHWLVLDNVNYCNASVLDRLNPLVEPDGVLSVNEQGLVDGQIRVIKPHPNFRIFATLDPKYGEISRAMRNRAVEIYVSPVEIPSLEGIAVAGVESACKNVSFLDSLCHYHRQFLVSDFYADCALSLSAKLSDATAAGAPNTFTLIKTAAMLQLDATPEDLKLCILHKYIQNRCGRGNLRKEELSENLTTTVKKLCEKDNCYPSMNDLMDALCLSKRNHGEEYVAEDIETALTRAYVHQSGLALSTRIENAEKYVISHSISDLLLFYVLEQCDVCMISNTVINASKTFLSSALRNVFPEDGVAEMLLLLSPKPSQCPVSALEYSWCCSTQVLGEHAAALKLACSTRILVSESRNLNNSLNHMLSVILRATREITSARVQQCVLRYFAPLILSLYTPSPTLQITMENFVPLVTLVALVRSVVKKHRVPHANEVVGSVDDFLTSLRIYLGLSFQLIANKWAFQEQIIRPRITTAEERTALTAWRNATNSVVPEVHSRLLKSLWNHAIFRSEFALIQDTRCLCKGYSVSAKAVLQNISKFVQLYCQKTRVLSELDVTLWQEVQLLFSQENGNSAVAALAPLLTTQLVARHGLNGGLLNLSGSWTRIAHEALSYSSEISIISIASNRSFHEDTLSGLLGFCRVLPVQHANPFSEWEKYCMAEVLSLLNMCYPSDRLVRKEHIVEIVDVQGDSTSDLLDGLRCFLSKSHDNSMLSLAQELVGMLVNENGSDLCSTLRRVALAEALRCRLLVPATPIDPMHKWLVKKETAHREISRLARMNEAFTWSEKITMHRQGSKQKGLLHDLQAAEEKFLVSASRKWVQRPDSSGNKYAQLVDSLHQICRTILSDERLAMVMGAKGNVESCAAQRTWSELLYQQVMDVLEKYGGYEDVTLTVAESALSAAMAVHINCTLQTLVAADGALFSASDARGMLHFPLLLVTSLPVPSPGTHALQHRLLYLDSCLLFIQSLPARVLKRGFVESVFESYRDLYRIVEELEAKERKEKEMSVLYKEKAITIEGDDEKHLRMLKELFPSYEEEFIQLRDMEEDTVEDNDKNNPAAADSAQHTTVASSVDRVGRHARIMLGGPRGARYIQRLLDTHYHFFECLLSLYDKTAFNGAGALEAFKCRFDVVSAEMRRCGRAGMYKWDAPAPPEDEQFLLGGFAARASLLWDDLFRSEVSLKEKKTNKFNIFCDPEPSELHAFSATLLLVIQSIKALQETYPDAPSLHRCARVAAGIASLPILTTPLMKVMTGCEILLRECYEWERNASCATSIMEQMTQLSSFVLRWRRLELHCWPQVFAAKREEFELKAGMAWFKLCNLTDIQQSAHLDDPHERYANFFQFCMDFMWNAHCGDFHVRLRLIKAFALRLAAEGGSATYPLANAAFHVVGFFTQFAELLSEKLRAAIAPIEEDMETFTRIMRWEDSTYYAVRATAEKSHLKMGRALTELQNALQKPALQIISEEERRCEDIAMGLAASTVHLKNKRSPKKNGRTPVDTNGASVGGDDAKKTKAGSKRMRSGRLATKGTLTAMRDPDADQVQESDDEACNRSMASSSMVLGIGFLRFASDEIVTRVKALQSSGAPQSQKVRALKTLFSVMEEKGVPHTHALQVPCWEELFATSSSLAACDCVHSNLSVSEDIKVATREYYKGARWLQRMRDAEKHPHKDLSGAQVKRGSGTAESLFAVAVEEAELIGVLCEVRHNTFLLRNCIAMCSETVTHDGAELLQGSVELCVQAHSFIHNVRWLLKERVFDLESACASLDELRSVAEELWEFCIANEGERRENIPVADTILAKRTALHRRMREVCAKLCNTGVGCVDSAALALCSHIDRGYSDASYPPMTPGGERSKKRARTELPEMWEEKVKTTISELESNFLDFHCSSSFCTLADEEGHTVECGGVEGSVYLSYTSFVRRLLNSSRAAHSSLQMLLNDSLTRRCLPVAVHQQLLESLSMIIECLDEHLRRTSDALYCQSRLTLVLSRLLCTLFQNGFCKSEEEDENDEGGGDDGGGGQLDGTGMDDGEGEKDVTDQIENEDQLMNAKDKENEANPEKKEDGDEDEKQQCDGEHDLAADNEMDGEGDSRCDTPTSSGDNSETGSDNEEMGNDSSACKDENDDLSGADSNSGDSIESSKPPCGLEGNEEDEGSNDEASDADDDDGSLNASTDDENADPIDKNVFHGGEQDEHAGEEATKLHEESKRRHAAQQNVAGTEEQQLCEEEQQTQNDTGRKWKQQDRDEQTQRRDNTESHAASHNPYRVIKEALSRHQRQLQRLNLNQRVDIKKQKQNNDEQHCQNEEKEWDEEIDEFDFDEEGEREGMAATDEKPAPVTVAQDDLQEPKETAQDDQMGDNNSSEMAEDDDNGIRHRRRVDSSINEDSGDENTGDRGMAKQRVKLVAKSTPKGESSEDDESSDTGDGEQLVMEDTSDKLTRGRQLWQEQVAEVHGLSHQLCEQLRLILAPTLADRLQGDYKTGKRLNMKRIIPYIASQFKKDRIWLRRTKPNKRNYQILVALDDSLSMQCNNAGVMSCRAVALLAEALQQLEIGELGMVRFGKDTRVVHDLHEPFTAESGPRAFSELTFAQRSTNLKLLLETTLNYLDEARHRKHGQTRSTTTQLQQMIFIISDGQITENRQELRKLLVRAEENRQMVVFVLLDVKAAGSLQDRVVSPTTGAKPFLEGDLKGLTPAERMRRLKAERDARLQRVQSNSVLDMQLVEFCGGAVVRRPYMQDFPFPYYLIVKELSTLPCAIADALRQWLELLNFSQ
uniref:Midasin n=1 Tax=Trypanosoma vivax (strain Y486) TaxID=1055687 RepID=G0TR15_TRYVY|nr:conserved hypothetical protein, fragment [Trypanosoma vivax Y486]